MQIAILGAGYGGLVLAQKLAWWLKRRGPHRIVLVDRNADHQLIVRLHEVAAGSIPPEDALVPYSRVLRGCDVEFRQAEVTGIDTAAQRVRTTAGDLGYDLLVVALGGETEYLGLPGVRENSLPVRTWEQAVRLRRHVEHQVVRARHAGDAARRRAHLTVVIGGGGYTGAELAGELSDRLRELVALHEVPCPGRILLLEAREHLLAGFPPAATQRATDALCDRGVEVCPETPAAGAEPGRVLLATGEPIAAGTFVWAGGVRAHPIVAESGLPVGLGGRARLDPYLRWEGHDDLFVIGDSSLVVDPDTGEPVPPTAQLAIQQAEHTAHNLHRMLAGRALVPFEGHPRAEVVSLGRDDAVALVGPALLSGRDARMLKNLTYRRHLYAIGA